MTIISTDFARLLTELSRYPDDPPSKDRLLGLIIPMKVVAENDAMTCYRLAKAFPASSETYLQFMRQSAKLGSTNAMLDLAELLLKSKNPAERKEARSYLDRIFDSNDTFIKAQAQDLVAKYPDCLDSLGKSGQSPRFFASGDQLGVVPTPNKGYKPH